jgi:hypothetical protein
VTEQPLSHNCPMDTSEVPREAAGNTWAVAAAGDRAKMPRRDPVPEEVAVSWLGKTMVMGDAVGATALSAWVSAALM